MMTLFRAIAGLALLLLPLPAPAQNTTVEELLLRAGPSKPRSQMQARIRGSSSTVEIRVRMAPQRPSLPRTHLQMQPDAPGSVTLELLERRSYSERQARRRPDDLAADRLVIASADAQGSLLDWAVIPDPRIVRSETPGPDGALSGTVFYRTDVELSVALPDDPAMTRIAIYVPRWMGQEWELELIGIVAVHQR